MKKKERITSRPLHELMGPTGLTGVEASELILEGMRKQKMYCIQQLLIQWGYVRDNKFKDYEIRVYWDGYDINCFVLCSIRSSMLFRLCFADIIFALQRNVPLVLFRAWERYREKGGVLAFREYTDCEDDIFEDDLRDFGIFATQRD